MAKKKKSLVQLDLFGLQEQAQQNDEAITTSLSNAAPNMVLAEPQQVELSTTAIVEANDQVVPASIDVPPIIEPTATAAANKPLLPPPPEVIYANENIAIRIKRKPIEPNIAITSAPNIQLEPYAKPPKEKQPTVAKQPTEDKPTTNAKVGKRGRKSFQEMEEGLDYLQIPDDETLNKKLYYSIGEVAAFFHVNPSLIRAWETKFSMIKPRKNRKGDRLFRVEDIKNLELIYFLLRNKKLSIESAKQYLQQNRKKLDTQLQLSQSLTKFRSFLLELKANLQA